MAGSPKSFHSPIAGRSSFRLETENRPHSPEVCCRSIKSYSSTSTLDSIGIPEHSSSPPLPTVLHVNVVELYKRPSDAAAPGWGVKLRGTTSELEEGLKIYACHIENVQEHGAAKDAGLREGDQIVSIDEKPVQKFAHEEVVKIFLTNERVVLAVLPSHFRMNTLLKLFISLDFKYNKLRFGIRSSSLRECSRVRILERNALSLKYIWALIEHLQILEIINVNLGNDGGVDVDLSSLRYLLELTVNHCSLKQLETLKGLKKLVALESLSLAHNLLSSNEVASFNFCSLKQLTKLDLSRNALDSIPENICNSLSRLETLILVDNSITEIPSTLQLLAKLQTLCLDGNLLHEVDPVLKTMDSIRSLTISNNHLEYESEVVKVNDLLIACIEGNPFTSQDGANMNSRNDPFFRRSFSMRGRIIGPTNTQVT